MYNTGSDTWIEKARLPYPLSAASALLVNNRQIALFGGDKGQIFTQIERLLRAAKEEPDSLKKDFLTKEKSGCNYNIRVSVIVYYCMICSQTGGKKEVLLLLTSESLQPQ